MKRAKMIMFVVLLSVAFLCIPACTQIKNLKNSSSQDLLVKSEVETAVSMLQAIFTKHQQGEMNLKQAKKLGADLLRELKYGTEGYFWADTTEGVNVVLYGRKDVEGRNRLEDKDHQGTFYIKEFLSKGKAGGGYAEYWFPKKGQTTAQPKRSYVLLFKPFGWVIGSGYYIEEIKYGNLSIESSKKLLEEVKELGPSLLMNIGSYNILLNELKKHKTEGIVINSLDGITIEANRNYLEMLGYTSAEIKSITYQELTPSKWHAMENDLFGKVMKTGYSGVYEKEYIRKDGTVFPIRIQSWLIMDKNHKASRLFGIIQDISSHKKTRDHE